MLINECRKLKLTRQHFTLIAEVIGSIDDDLNRELVANDWGRLLATTNRLFDQDKFNAKVEEVHQSCWADRGPWYGE